MAAALPQETIDLRDVVLPLIGLSNVGAFANRQTSQFIALHQITSVENFTRLEPHQAKDLVKASNARHPAQSMGILAQNNLTGLIWYCKDMGRRGLPLDPYAITEDDLVDGHLAYEAYVQNRDKGDNIKSLEKWSDKCDFDDWDRKVTETLSLVYGRKYCPLAYVIRPDKPPGWDPVVDASTDYERLMYQLPLNGVAYNRDNETVFSFIQLAVLQTPAETWIFDAVAGRDGRGAMRALRNHYEGEAELDVRATKAQQTLDTITYTSERNMPFEQMITTLNKSYNVLKKQGQEFTDKSKVEQLAKRIKNPGKDIQITVAVETMLTQHRNNYTAATQYITSRMAQINSANINVPGQNQRRINEVGAGLDTDRNEYNSVDITDPWREFTKDEWWRQLGKKGRMLVEAKRTKMAASRGNNHRGGRGGRGYGRGGRGGRYGGRGVRGGRGGNYSNNPTNNQNNNNRNVNEANSNDRVNDQANGNNANGGSSSTQQSVSTMSLSQASTNGDRGGQNGNRFGGNRA